VTTASATSTKSQAGISKPAKNKPLVSARRSVVMALGSPKSPRGVQRARSRYSSQANDEAPTTPISAGSLAHSATAVVSTITTALARLQRVYSITADQ
jgi:hypothetical protein